jgi:pimeloyl-ACP methyl ester carboxylesterase
MWRGFVPELSKHFNVICIDLLGQGESGSLGYVHSMEEHALAVLKVLEAENIERFSVVGHSMGGYIALAIAKLTQERIEKLVLFHSTAVADSDERRKDRERIIELLKKNKSVYVKTVIPSLFAEETRIGLKKEIREVIQIANGFSVQGIAANIRGMMQREQAFDVLRDAAFKALILHGRLDPVIQTESVEEQARLNKNIQLEVVDHIGHMGHLEAPETSLDILTHFLKN